MVNQNNTIITNVINYYSNITLTVSPSQVYRGDTVTISGYLYMDNGTAIAYQNVTLYWNGIFIVNVTTDSTGYYSYTYIVPSNEQFGYANVTAVFYGSGQYLGLNTTQTVIVMSTTIITIYLNDSTVIHGESFEVYGLLKDEDSNPISGATVEVRLIASTTYVYFVTTNSTGYYYLVITVPVTIVGGIHTVEVYYQGSIFYTASSNQTSIVIIERSETYVSASPYNVVRGSNLTIAIHLVTDYGLGIANATVSIYINGTLEANVTTDSNGYATYIKYIPQNTTISGNYIILNITAVYNGATYTLGSSGNATARVVKAALVNLQTSDGRSLYNRSELIQINGLLLDDLGNPLANETVLIRLYYPNGTFIDYGNYVTDANGKFSFTYQFPSSANPGFYVTFNGTALNQTISSSNSLTLTLLSPTQINFVLNDYKFVNGSTFILSGNVTDDLNNLITSGNVTLYFGNAIYEQVISGSFTFSINLNYNDSYIIQGYLTYEPIYQYYLSSTSQLFTVYVYARINITITLNRDLLKRGENLIINCTVKDDKLGPLNNTYVQLTIDGSVVQTLITDSNGFVSFNYTVPLTASINIHNATIIVMSQAWYYAKSKLYNVYAEVNFEASSINKNEFISGETLQISGTAKDDLGNIVTFGDVNVSVYFKDAPSYDFSTTVAIDPLTGSFIVSFVLPNTSRSTPFNVTLHFVYSNPNYHSLDKVYYNYLHAFVNFTLFVYNQTEKVYVFNTTRGTNVTLGSYIYDEIGPFPGPKSVQLYINGTLNKTFPISSGSLFNISLVFDQLGLYVIQLRLEGFSNVVSNQVMVYVRAQTEIKVYSIKTNYLLNETLILNGSLIDEFNTSIGFNGFIYLSVYYKQVGLYDNKLVPVTNGAFFYNYTFINIDRSSEVIIELKFNSTGTTYYPAVFTETINVYKSITVNLAGEMYTIILPIEESTQSLTPLQTGGQTVTVYMNTTRGVEITVMGYLYASDNYGSFPIVNERVVLNIYDGSWRMVENYTASTGLFILKYTFNTSSDLGLHEFYISLPDLGNVVYPASGYYYILVYSSTSMSITYITPGNATWGDTVTITGSIIDDAGDPVLGGQVILYISEYSYATSVSNGQFTFNVQIPNDTKDDLGILIVYNSTGTIEYIDSNITGLIYIYYEVYFVGEVNPKVIDLTSLDLGIEGEIVDENQRPINSKNLTILIKANGSLIGTISSINGVINGTIQLNISNSSENRVKYVLQLYWIRGGEEIEAVAPRYLVVIVNPSAYLSNFRANPGDIGLLAFPSLFLYIALIYFGIGATIVIYDTTLYIRRKLKLRQKKRNIKDIRDKVLEVLKVVDPEKAKILEKKLEELEASDEILEIPIEVLDIPEIFVNLIDLLKQERYLDGVIIIVDDYLNRLEEVHELIRAYNETPREFGERVSNTLFRGDDKKIKANRDLATLYSMLAYSDLNFKREHLVMGIKGLMSIYLDLHPEDEEKYTGSVINWIMGKIEAM